MQTKIINAGWTLIEVIIAFCIVGILITLTAPTFANLIEGYRLKAATELLYSDLQLAKTEAIKRNKQVRVNFQISNAGATWCYGIKEQSSCDCNVDSGPSLCHIDNIPKWTRSADFPNIHLRTSISSPGDHFSFEGVRGITVSTFGKILLTSTAGQETRVIVSRLARIRYCSPAGNANVTGYPSSC